MTPKMFVSQMDDDDIQTMLRNSSQLWIKEKQEVLFNIYEKYLDGWKVNRSCGKCRAHAMTLISNIINYLKDEYT